MYIIATIFLTILISEIFLSLYPLHIWKKKRRIVLRIKSGNEVYDKPITIFKNNREKKYTISHESTCFLQLSPKNTLLLYSPDSVPLIHGIIRKEYDIGNGQRVSLKRRKPVFLFSISYILVVTIMLTFFKYYAKNKAITFTDTAKPVVLTHDFSENIEHEKWSGITNYLLIGSDARSGLVGARADAIILISMREDTKEINICSLLRDTKSSIYDKEILTYEKLDSSKKNYEFFESSAVLTPFFDAKLNSAVEVEYQYDEEQQVDSFASGLNTFVNTVEYNFGIPISGVISISWEDVIDICDTVGGLDLSIDEDMLIDYYDEDNDKHYGIKAVLQNQNALYGFTDQIVESGLQHLNGNEILGFARLRYIYGRTNSDIERSSRIRYCVSEMLRQKFFQLLSLLGDEKFQEISKPIYSSLTDEDTNHIIEFVSSVPSLKNMGTLPYLYNEHVKIGKEEYITVDGYNQDLLPQQALKLLCN